MTRIQQIEARKMEIRKLLEGTEQVDLEALEKELRDLDTEKQQIEKRQSLAKGIQAAENEPEQRQLPGAENPLKEDPQKEARKVREERGRALKENRSVTVGSSNVVLPKHDSPTINPTFNEVSSLIDRVKAMPLPGGESFDQPYLEGYGTGDYTTEGADYADAEPTFNKANIKKTKITAYAEDSEEVQKLPAADYDSVVMNGITVATRKKITREILIGDGATNHLAGIFSTAATAIDAATDLEITGIDDKTLDNIIYSYGGDEDVEDVAVLILNKKDLKAFATLRNSDGKKTYNVVNNGNTGTIDGVPYIINSACKAISDVATVAGAYVMAYGPLSNYTIAIFSDLDVQRSTDYKFKQGMIAHKGSIFIGGNVTAKNGFLRVKKDDGV
jgi:Phage capsid family.